MSPGKPFIRWSATLFGKRHALNRSSGRAPAQARPRRRRSPGPPQPAWPGRTCRRPGGWPGCPGSACRLGRLGPARGLWVPGPRAGRPCSGRSHAAARRRVAEPGAVPARPLPAARAARGPPHEHHGPLPKTPAGPRAGGQALEQA